MTKRPRSHQYGINISDVRVAMDITRAWDERAVSSASTRIEFTGTHRVLWSFRNRRRFVTGQMHFWHYTSRVMSVDFDQDLITDHGFSGFSSTTTTYIRTWRWALEHADIPGLQSVVGCMSPFEWTARAANVRGAGRHRDMWERFRAGVPWTRRIDGSWWFHAPSFSIDLLAQYKRSRDDLLNDGVSWHWFTYDWDNGGQWTKRFIDADAERRWNKRQAKRAA